MNASENNLKLLLEAVLHFHLHADGLGYLHVASATTKSMSVSCRQSEWTDKKKRRRRTCYYIFLILCSLQQTEMRVAESRGKMLCNCLLTILQMDNIYNRQEKHWAGAGMLAYSWGFCGLGVRLLSDPPLLVPCMSEGPATIIHHGMDTKFMERRQRSQAETQLLSIMKKNYWRCMTFKQIAG